VSKIKGKNASQGKKPVPIISNCLMKAKQPLSVGSAMIKVYSNIYEHPLELVVAFCESDDG
jgi:hypothetical protein